MKLLQRLVLLGFFSLVLPLIDGCTTAMIVAHVHAQVTEGDPTPCIRLNSVERALSPRCGAFAEGSLRAADIAAPGLPACPLMLAARDARLWPVLPELLAKGAAPEACRDAPLAALARANPWPDFALATPASLASLRWLAEADAHSIQHDVVRMLSGPSARAAGLSGVLDAWLAQGLLPADGSLAFNPLSALHPDALATPLARALEAAGHRAAIGSYDGRLASGFDEALRTGRWAALDWWLARVPELAARVPAARANQLPWVPLAQVLTPNYLAYPEQRRALVEYLIAHGADPWASLPHEPTRSVASYARELQSPLVALLEAPRGLAAVRAAKPLASAGTALTPLASTR
jgi:hypothetical protein